MLDQIQEQRELTFTTTKNKSIIFNTDFHIQSKGNIQNDNVDL